MDQRYLIWKTLWRQGGDNSFWNVTKRFQRRTRRNYIDFGQGLITFETVSAHRFLSLNVEICLIRYMAYCNKCKECVGLPQNCRSVFILYENMILIMFKFNIRFTIEKNYRKNSWSWLLTEIIYKYIEWSIIAIKIWYFNLTKLRTTFILYYFSSSMLNLSHQDIKSWFIYYIVLYYKPHKALSISPLAMAQVLATLRGTLLPIPLLPTPLICSFFSKTRNCDGFLCCPLAAVIEKQTFSQKNSLKKKKFFYSF